MFYIIGFIWNKIIINLISHVLLWTIALLHNQIGLGIIVFTIALRILMIPLSYNQEKAGHYRSKFISPKYSALERKYNTRDTSTMQQLYEHRYHLQKVVDKHTHGKHHYTLLFILLELIIMIGLLEVVRRTPSLHQGTFLWVELSKADPYHILPFIAGIVTFASQYVINQIDHSWSHLNQIMMWSFTIFIIITAWRATATLVIYWISLYISNIVQEIIIGLIWRKSDKKIIQKRKRQKQTA